MLNLVQGYFRGTARSVFDRANENITRRANMSPRASLNHRHAGRNHILSRAESFLERRDTTGGAIGKAQVNAYNTGLVYQRRQHPLADLFDGAIAFP